MVPILLGANSLVWYWVWKVHKGDKAIGPYPENPTFDQDLDDLWNAGPIRYTPRARVLTQDKTEDLLIKKDFQRWLTTDKTLEDYLWEEGIINPDSRPIWCNGTPLLPGDTEDLKAFYKIKDDAYLKGEYNSKLLVEGGDHDLKIAWFMLLGCSDFGAERLVELGVNPWEWKYGT